MLRRRSEVNHVTMELTPELQGKKIFLIEGLKKTYKNQYNAIQPLPYIKDRLYCVDKVFVEGGVEVCLAPELTRGTGGSWERLESYKSVYTDLRLKSKRRIIQGEPGYGKSTLTLQLAYDWCNNVSNSSLRNVDILILLQLRQLGSVKSFFRAIKSFLLFHEPRVSKHEIEKIIHSCSSVHIILDGYDEYPGRDSNDNDDVHSIIKMELFADFDVSLTTRYLPDNLRQETKRAKLTGFDDNARDEYIRKAVVGNNNDAMEEIKQRLNENSILADLCQVPLIFVMFAHMAHDEGDFKTFKSVTQFFKHIIRCFYNHLKQKRKLYDNRNNRFYLHEMEHHELDKIAFEGLNKKNQQLSWIKTEFRERVGPESYDQYIIIGILVEEDEVSDDSIGDNVLFTTMVRFYHKLFCEWYAAHHLVTLVKNAYDIEDTLEFLDQFDLQYLFRFACGLDPDAGKKLINHLKSLPGGDTFAILCFLEQTGDVNDMMDSVKDLCSRDVKIKRGDSALLQRSTTQLLEIASKNDIPISCLHLDYSSIKFEGDTIILHSGISLPKLPTVEKIHIAGSNDIYGNTETLKDNDLLNLSYYGLKCGRIKELMFSRLHLPTSVSPEAFTDIMKTRNIQVRWRPFDVDFHLDLQSGHWEVDDTQVLENIRSSTVSIDGRVLQQISTVQLLHVAHRHNIPISTLLFSKSFMTTAHETIILNNGIRITNLPPLQKIHDVDNNSCNAINDQDIANILLCVITGQHFNEICFEGWLMPVSLSSAFTNWMLSLALNVLWRPFDNNFRLDLQTGHWEVVDNQVMENIRCSTVSIDGKHSVLQQRSTVQLIHVAHRHNIPISSLLFNESFKTTAHETIILNNGIQLTNLPPLQKIHVVDKNQRNTSEMTEQDIVNILLCAMKDQHFNVLCFEGCRLPVSLSSSSFTNMMISRAIKVSWCPFDSVFHLDLQTGLWEVNDFEAIRDSYSNIISINESDTILQQRSKVQLLYIAANHDTPISCLHLNKSVKHYQEESCVLHSGIHLKPMTTVEHLCIEKGMGRKKELRKITKPDMRKIFLYGMKSQKLKDISFRGCLLPVDNLSKYIPSDMKGRDIKITWPECGYRLNLQTGEWEVGEMDTFRTLCTKTVEINLQYNKTLQRYAIRLLENAAKHDIPISCLYLNNSFSKIGDGSIILRSGLHLWCPALVKKVVIHTTGGREMTETEVVGILMYLQHSQLLEELEFDGCLLPLTFSSESIPAELQSRKIKVSWSNYGYSLNLQLGLWEVDDVDTVKRLCTEKVDFDIEFLQRCTIKLLENASNHDIPISCLYMEESFSKIDAGDVILLSGLRLSCPATVKKVVIYIEEGREMTETEVVDILKFVQKSHLLEVLEFDGCLLPSISSSEAILAEFKTRDIKVLWMSCGYSLNFQSGAWEVDVDTVKCLCTEEVEISDEDSISRQRCTIQLLENASAHDIPISCLNLNESYCKIDAGDVILDSGLRLSCPASVKKVVICTYDAEREMTETEVVDILMFVQHSHMLEELTFEWCLLPQSIPAESIPSILKSKNVKVAWQMHRTQFQLNFQSGQWMDGDRVLG